MNLVDSSCWLEYFAGSPLSAKYAAVIEKTTGLIVPTICLYEVFKKVLRERDEDSALQAIAQMRQGRVVDLSAQVAVEAAVLSLRHRLPMPDSIILATALSAGATLWTQDEDFREIPGVRYFAKG